MNVLLTLTVLTMGSALTCIYARYRGPKTLFYILKPLTTSIIIVIALYRMGIGAGVHGVYPYFIVAGLVLGLVGDICLMFPQTLFVYGLGSFLIGHVLYIIAFLFSQDRIGVTPWLVVVVGLIAISFTGFILPVVKSIKIPVAIYIMVITLMLWSSWERFLSLNNEYALLAAIGSVLFILSDITLAINKFKSEFKSAELLVLGTYFPAIWLIASSI